MQIETLIFAGCIVGCVVGFIWGVMRMVGRDEEDEKLQARLTGGKAAEAAARPTHGGGPTTAERLTHLEATVADLLEAVTTLRQEVAALRSPQDEHLTAE